MSLPTADDLFRPTASPADGGPPDAPAPPSRKTAPGKTSGKTSGKSSGERGSSPEPPQKVAAEAAAPQAEQPATAERRPSGRVRHDEKMTVYVTADELLDLEHARLTLRRTTGLAVDRGRLVREAVAIALADLDANGEDSVLVQRLTQS